MTKFNTGNPVGSSDPRDLFDNAAVADKLVTGAGATYNDRLGKPRKSWQGIEDEFAAFIAASGYEFVGDYAAGIEITGYNQVVRDTGGEFWRVSGSTNLPYTTTGSGLPEGGAFVAVGDAALRQELNGPLSSGQGAALVKGAPIYAGSVAELEGFSLAEGVNVYLTEESKAGPFVVKTGTPPSDPKKGIYIFLANGKYAERQFGQNAMMWPSVKPQWFGAKAGDSAFDNKAVYDAVCDLLKAQGSGGEIVWPGGDFYFSKIVLRDRIRIAGQGQDVTNFLPLAASAPAAQDPNFGFFEQDSGRVRGVHLSGFSAWGNQTKINSDAPLNAGQWAFYLRAKFDDAFNDGGLWDFTTDDVRAPGWTNGLWSRGGYTTAHSKLPQQWFDCRKLTLICSDTSGEPLRLTGQHGQISFGGGGRAEYAFGGEVSANYNVTVDWDPNPSEVETGTNGESSSDVSGSGNAVRAPTNVTIGDGFTIQLGNGVYARNNKGCYLDGAWFENCTGGAFADSSGHISIERTHFAAMENNAGNGYLYKVGSNGSVDWGAGNEIFGTFENFMLSVSNTQRKTQHSHDGWISTLGEFQTGAPTVAIASSIDIDGNQFVNLNCSDQTIDLATIDSTLCPGMMISFRVINGNLRLTSTGNVRFPAGYNNPKVFPNNSTVTLVRAFDSKEFHLVTPDIPFYATAEPTDGRYYHVGTNVWNLQGGTGQPLGWRCNVSGIAGTDAAFNAMPSIP